MRNLSKPQIKQIKKQVYYTAIGKLKNIKDIIPFVLNSSKEAKRLNPKLKCSKNDYCFGIFKDNPVKFHNFTYQYYQAVTKAGKENKNIKFKTLPKENVLAFEYIGKYSKLSKVYKAILKKMKKAGVSVLDIVGPIREVYIDGPWNKDNPSEYKTEIQIPIKSTVVELFQI